MNTRRLFVHEGVQHGHFEDAFDLRRSNPFQDEMKQSDE